LPQRHVTFNKSTLDSSALYSALRSPGQLWSNKQVSTTPSYELIGNFISTCFRVCKDPKVSQFMYILDRENNYIQYLSISLIM